MQTFQVFKTWKVWQEIADNRSAGFACMDVGKGREQERKLRLQAQAEHALPLK
jgi:hypothetical protein